MQKILVLLLALSVFSCSTVRLNYRGDIAAKDGSIKLDATHISYTRSYDLNSQPILCAVTAMYYGGFCWGYLLMPYDSQKLTIYEDVIDYLDEVYPDVDWKLSNHQYSQLNWESLPVKVSLGKRKAKEQGVREKAVNPQKIILAQPVEEDVTEGKGRPDTLDELRQVMGFDGYIMSRFSHLAAHFNLKPIPQLEIGVGPGVEMPLRFLEYVTNFQIQMKLKGPSFAPRHKILPFVRFMFAKRSNYLRGKLFRDGFVANFGMLFQAAIFEFGYNSTFLKGKLTDDGFGLAFGLSI